MKDCRFRDEPYGCGRSLCQYPWGEVLCDPEPTPNPKETSDFGKFLCHKIVCPIIKYEDFDSTGCCPLCGTLGEKA